MCCRWGIGCDGSRYQLSSEVYTITEGKHTGQKVRIILNDDDGYVDKEFSKTLSVCFLGGRYVEPFEVGKNQIVML